MGLGQREMRILQRNYKRRLGHIKNLRERGRHEYIQREI